MLTVEKIRKIFKEKLEKSDFVIDKTGVKTIEIINASFTADEPVIFGSLNMDYVNREISWYESQSLNVNDIKGDIPKIWQQVADKAWADYAHSKIFYDLQKVYPNLQLGPIYWNAASYHIYERHFHLMK